MVHYVIISNAYTEELSRSFVWRDKKIYIASEGKPENLLKEITLAEPINAFKFQGRQALAKSAGHFDQ